MKNGAWFSQLQSLTGPTPWRRIEDRNCSRVGSSRLRGYFSTKSAHFWIWSSWPHGMIGTDDVEFFGEPSIRRSE
jgi:hypothetical protein